MTTEQTAAKVVEDHAQATKRDWSANDHRLYELVLRALRAAPAPTDDLRAALEDVRRLMWNGPAKVQLDAVIRALPPVCPFCAAGLACRVAPPAPLTREPIQRLIDAAVRYAERIEADTPKGSMSTVALMWRMLAVDAQSALASPAGETPAPEGTCGSCGHAAHGAYECRAIRPGANVVLVPEDYCQCRQAPAPEGN